MSVYRVKVLVSVLCGLGLFLQTFAPPWGFFMIAALLIVVLIVALVRWLFPGPVGSRYPQRAFREGSVARRHGRGEVANPYPPGTSEHGGWRAGWGRS